MTPHPDMTATTQTTTGTTTTTSQAPRTTRREPDVPWLPSQIPGRDTTATVLLAATAGTGDLHGGHRLRPRAKGWAEQSGLTGPAATVPASRPPRGFASQQEHARGLPDRGVAD